MGLFEPTTEMRQEEVLTVSEVTRNIKVLLETALPILWVEGEISNFKHHSSGHMYFSLKDENAQISCVFWAGRNMNLTFRPQDGMQVLVKGRVTVFERRGQYQLDVLQLLPAGVGALQLAFEQLKKRLSEEGLFDTEHKKPLPRFPRRIGIVTSPTGAAIRDLLSVIRRRWPSSEIVLRPTLVQGPEAAQDIARAIQEFNAFGEVDVLIVGRGGGSMEDLWAFNEEVVARAIFESEIPIISAVGHEIDFTIADFVADKRAPTPSVAGEMVVPDSQEILQQLQHQLLRAYRLVHGQIQQAREKLNGLQSSYGLRRPLDILRQHQQALDELNRRLEQAIGQHVERQKMRLEALTRQLQALSYENVLQRGFALVRDHDTKALLMTAAQVQPEQQIDILFQDGEAGARVVSVQQNTQQPEQNRTD